MPATADSICAKDSAPRNTEQRGAGSNSLGIMLLLQET